MASNRRKFRRVAAGVRVLYSGSAVDRHTREYLEGIARDLSIGGLFLETRSPMPKGTIVDLDVWVESDSEENPVHARAIVRWVRRFFRPRGMGLEFIDIEGLGARQLEAWVRRVLE
jgi:c-di-GMP-binding flagellar brake protein YcgR